MAFCFWCGKPAITETVRFCLPPALGGERIATTDGANKTIVAECENCCCLANRDLIDQQLHVRVPSGILIAKRSLVPDSPGIDIFFIPNEDTEPILLAAIEDYRTAIRLGTDAPVEHHIPESRTATEFCEIDRVDVSVMTPGLACRVFPKIYSESIDSVNTAFDYTPYADREEVRPDAF